MLRETFNGEYVTYEIYNKRKFDDFRGRIKDDILLKEWLEILLLDRNVLIYFDCEEIRCTLKSIKNIPALTEEHLKRDSNASNFFTVYEIETKEFVTFHVYDVRKFIVRSEGVTELSSYENQVRFRAEKSASQSNKV